MAYRNERDALQAQCDTLRRQLAESEAGSETLQEANDNLKATLEKLGALRISEAERQIATGDLSRRAKLVGVAVTLFVVVLVLTGVNFYVWQGQDEAPVEPVIVDRTDQPVTVEVPFDRAKMLRDRERLRRERKDRQGHERAVTPNRENPSDREPALTKKELAQLDRDIDKLIKADPSPKAVREIRSMMESDERGTLGKAISKMNMIRPKAAVPMLLKRAGSEGRQHPSDTGLMGYAFTSLTGEAIDRNWGLNQRNTGQVYREWWKNSRRTFTTDICKMTEEQRIRVVRLMAQRRSGRANWGQAESMGYRGAPRGDVFGASLCPKMVEDILYVIDDKPMRRGATTMLAALYKRGDAPQLQGILRSKKSTRVQRLTALLAMADAGEPIDQKRLIEMFKTEKDPDLQEAMLYAMGRCDASVVPYLVKEVDGENSRAAVHALRNFKSPASVGALRRVLLSTKSSNGMRSVTALLASIQTPEAIEALAANLERLSKLDNAPEDWGNTLRDFAGATNNVSPLRGGSRTVEGKRATARTLLADWRASK